jgi:hypothetical protein
VLEDGAMAIAPGRLLWPLLLYAPLLLSRVVAGPRYSSRIVDTQSGKLN